MPESGQTQKPTLSWSTPADHRPAVLPTPPSLKPSAPKSERTRGWWFFAACGFAGGIAAILAWQYLVVPPPLVQKVGPANDIGSAKAPQNAAAAAGANASYSRDSVTALSPQKAGFVAMVSTIFVSAPTWAVVYDDNDHMPGKALGAQLFFPGDETGIITLVRPTVSGRTYLIGLQVDDGDHNYEHYGDAQVIDEEGRSVLSPFSVQ